MFSVPALYRHGHDGMRITRIQAKIVEHAIRPDRTIISILGRHDKARHVCCAVEDAEGHVGYGECAPHVIWNGESAETVLQTINNVLKPLLADSSIEHPNEVSDLLDKKIYGMPYAKAAVETACWDLWGKANQKSILDVIADRSPVMQLPTRGSIGAYPPAETLQIAMGLWGQGVRTLKFKVGVPPDDDAARLAAVREALGDAPSFTIDANGAYTSFEQAKEAIQKLLPFKLDVIEQPFPRERIQLMARLKKEFSVPLMIDEGVFTPEHLAEAIDLDAFDLVSLNPGKNGGFGNTWRMALQAQRAGKQCVIGCNLESELGQAAFACLAAGCSAFPVREFPGDFQAGLFFDSWLERPTPLVDGSLAVPRGPGFGVTPRIRFEGD